LDRLGVFSYSDEDTSGSYALDGKVDGRTISNRKRRLMAIQRKISRAKNRSMVGREVSVLVEGPSADTDLLWQARMSTQAPEIDGTVLINDFEGGEPARGQMRLLRITEAHDYDLIGTLLASTEPDVRSQDAQMPVLVHIAPALAQSAPGFVIPNLIPAR
jgi:ribosomal protein S12 methylthiotransferase